MISRNRRSESLYWPCLASARAVAVWLLAQRRGSVAFSEEAESCFVSAADCCESALRLVNRMAANAQRCWRRARLKGVLRSGGSSLLSALLISWGKALTLTQSLTGS